MTGVWGSDPSLSQGGPPPKPEPGSDGPTPPNPTEDSHRKLSYAKQRLSDSQVARLSFPKDTYSYSEVDFSLNAVSSVGLSVVAEICLKCPSLRVLKLFKNRLDDKAVTSLAEIIDRNQSLREVHLSHNELTEEGITRIVEAATFSKRDCAEPLWLRVENNKVASQPTLLDRLERQYAVCPRRPKCAQFNCSMGSKIHLPFLNMQRERAEAEEAANMSGVFLRSRSPQRPSPRRPSPSGPPGRAPERPRLRSRSLRRRAPSLRRRRRRRRDGASVSASASRPRSRSRHPLAQLAPRRSPPRQRRREDSAARSSKRRREDAAPRERREAPRPVSRRRSEPRRERSPHSRRPAPRLDADLGYARADREPLQPLDDVPHVDDLRLRLARLLGKA